MKIPDAIPLSRLFHITSFAIAITATEQKFIFFSFREDGGMILIIDSVDSCTFSFCDNSCTIKTHRHETLGHNDSIQKIFVTLPATSVRRRTCDAVPCEFMPNWQGTSEIQPNKVPQEVVHRSRYGLVS